MSSLDILAFGAHPDDVEIGMGGTIAKHVQAGLRVGICDLTRAEMSSNGTVEQRRQEADEASKVLGLAHRSCLALPDRGLTGSEEQIAAIVKEIRLHRPRLVFAPYWEDRHPDHNSCSHIIEEAVFNSKLRRYMPELPPVQVDQLFFYYINDMHDVRLTIDISGCYELKIKALQCYRSQFEPAREGEDKVATPLNQRYIERVEARDQLLGSQRQLAYAEGFTMKQPHLVDYL
ncbi:bacillithiol biosynthesis deacetylase BshB1 [Paenibacillus sambharensis]|uniref:Bacillithiol biosynthesis deacetylase BshB1 n=1 Tax=Paenibacillus sambharensis TaxID=1803190 RepID=A0A2W1LP08_9BACL|nr:bacillithiol biosynthesis deacetylase BshB1 [Paenibacillus sambharensis]PZD93561.1 bacillithiol biosynthesis deacetylase BshB1 [Paenibacillus sambharensis]